MILRPKSKMNYREEPYFSWFETVDVSNWNQYIRHWWSNTDILICYLDDNRTWVPQFLVKSVANKGRGLFAARRIDAHQSITVYIGDKHDITENNGDAYTLTNMDESLTIRANKNMILGGAHLINEGETSGTRNCEIGPRFIFESTTSIEKGDEILTYYGKGYKFRHRYNVSESESESESE
jgi:hypothetical protein